MIWRVSSGPGSLVLAVLAVIVSVGAGCAGVAETFSSDQPGLDGPVMRYQERAVRGGEDAEIRGVITIEGDCLYLAPPSGEGERYPVVWPYGVEWDAETPGVRLRLGTVLAAGELVETSGGYHDIESVRAISGEDAAELVASCLDTTDGEIAIMNNFASLEGFG